MDFEKILNREAMNEQSRMDEELPQVRRSVLLFFITLCSVFLVYGFQWTNGNPLTDPVIAWQSGQFAVALMSILLCHEMGHYWVARYHGFALSVPYFLPFPFAFGTLGAVIQLRSLPKSRTALLEMGAAGPIAGFLVTIFCILVGAKETRNNLYVEIEGNREAYIQAIETIEVTEKTWMSEWLGWLGSTPTIEQVDVLIMSDPIVMKMLHLPFLEEPLSPYAELSPIAFAGWVGCLITSINLLPIGQLDGGHIANAVLPKYATTISKTLLVLIFCVGLLTWKGWCVWTVLLWWMRATEPVGVPRRTKLTFRAKGIAVLSLIVFVMCAMLEPIYTASIPIDEVFWVEPEQNSK